jgi:hypothetical protein
MNRIAGLAILIVGIILLGWGMSASDSIGSSFSRLFTGAPTDKTIFLVIGGAVLTAVGAGAMLIPARKP